MREILFRGKRIDNGEWVHGDLVQLHDGRRYIVNNIHGACLDDKGNFINTEAPFVVEVDPSTVGQYTGLTDENGKRIFEGDIVDGNDYKAEDGYGIIEFSDGAFEVVGNGISGTFHLNYWGYEFEVIDNIHDNPELMEVDHE